jgi:hypothetical protein
MDQFFYMFGGDLLFAGVTVVCVATIAVSMLRGVRRRRKAA